MSAFEQSEILEYSECWYLGNSDLKVKGLPTAPYNNGYDNEHGDYKMILHDHIGYRFEILELLGKGSFGQVIKVFDHKLQQIKAIKVICNKQRFQKQALVEVKLLNFCNVKVESICFNFNINRTRVEFQILFVWTSFLHFASIYALLLNC